MPPPGTITFAVHGPIARSDLPGLCARICRVIEHGAAEVATCDVGAVEADAVTVEALARLALLARRRGCRIELQRASEALLALVAWMGLGDVLTAAPGSRAPV